MAAPTVYSLALTLYYTAAEHLHYAATRAFTTSPTDTPANTFFDERLLVPAAVKRDMFDSGTIGGRSRTGYGDAVLANGDGALDAWRTYAIDGRAVVQRRGTLGGAYPGTTSVVFTGTAVQLIFEPDTVRVKLRDAQAELETPFQTSKYLGNNALPAGLEGVATDLKGKPKPVVLGSPYNVPATLVNSSKLIYQVHDGALAAITAVYDRGIKLTGGSWATASTMTDQQEVWGCSYSPALALYIAVGYDTVNLVSRVRTSPDGVTWTTRPDADVTVNLQKLYGACWSPKLGIFCVAGANGMMATSTDGTNWTPRTSGFGGTRIISVCWSEALTLFCAVGVGGTLTTSPDGVTWTAQTSNAGGNDLNGVAFGLGLFVAAGSNGIVITSPDGVTWTSRANSFGATTVVRSITYGQPLVGPGMFVGVGDSGIAITSLDGETWALSRKTGLTSNIYRVAFANNAFVAVGQTGKLIMSPDGYTWKEKTSGFGTTYIYDLCYGAAAGWLLVGDASKYCLNSLGGYANQTDLLDDTLAPAPGEVKVYLGGGMFRLGMTPSGLVTCDPTHGASAADRTAAQLFKYVLGRKGYVSGTDYSAADVTALDAANGAELGDYIADESTTGAILDRLANTVGAWWGPDLSGIYRIAQFAAPSGSPALTVVENDVISLKRIEPNDGRNGLPTYKTIYRYKKNHAVQTSDVAAGVDAARRGEIGREWREVVKEDTAVSAAHLLAPQASRDTLFIDATAAQTECDRMQLLTGVQRDRFELVMELNGETELIDLYPVLRLTYSRYGLSAGQLFRILGIDPKYEQKRVVFTLWGATA